MHVALKVKSFFWSKTGTTKYKIKKYRIMKNRKNFYQFCLGSISLSLLFSKCEFDFCFTKEVFHILRLESLIVIRWNAKFRSSVCQIFGGVIKSWITTE